MAAGEGVRMQMTGGRQVPLAAQAVVAVIRPLPPRLLMQTVLTGTGD